ncbi:hypothetical protein AMJ87_12415 [candidate division WOR_3 bacterium SM23_60]|uniref:Outer membrane protein beta-barrel domain-containing protein n=1 Tax=candidate division WOR_3 bacterium SM23_60 TaxID=1703780 RepID=A0A0S8G4Y7_UNCW3|nr:MAG: hypothetical protein AMJ87_12415 [candidate division WOR_3 bacterium SM23_60]
MLSRAKGMIVILIVGFVISPVLSRAHGAVRKISSPPEDETLIRGKPQIGGFIAPVMSMSRVNEQGAVLVGLRGGIIINRSFVLGLAGYGLANDVDISPFDYRHLDFGYGGFFLEYVNRPHKLVHLSVHSLIGGGGLRHREDWYDDWFDGRYADAVFVFEPGLDVIVNITKHIRLGIGGSYRMVRDVELGSLDDNDISGPSASLIFKFGRF